MGNLFQDCRRPSTDIDLTAFRIIHGQARTVVQRRRADEELQFQVSTPCPFTSWFQNADIDPYISRARNRQVSFAYNWDSSYSGSLPDGVVYFPMLWSAAPEHSNQWVANANAAIAKGSTHLLL